MASGGKSFQFKMSICGGFKKKIENDLNQVGHEILEWECLFKFGDSLKSLKSQEATKGRRPNRFEDARKTKIHRKAKP